MNHLAKPLVFAAIVGLCACSGKQGANGLRAGPAAAPRPGESVPVPEVASAASADVHVMGSVSAPDDDLTVLAPVSTSLQLATAAPAAIECRTYGATPKVCRQDLASADRHSAVFAFDCVGVAGQSLGCELQLAGKRNAIFLAGVPLADVGAGTLDLAILKDTKGLADAKIDAAKSSAVTNAAADIARLGAKSTKLAAAFTGTWDFECLDKVTYDNGDGTKEEAQTCDALGFDHTSTFFNDFTNAAGDRLVSRWKDKASFDVCYPDGNEKGSPTLGLRLDGELIPLPAELRNNFGPFIDAVYAKLPSAVRQAQLATWATDPAVIAKRAACKSAATATPACAIATDGLWAGVSGEGRLALEQKLTEMITQNLVAGGNDFKAGNAPDPCESYLKPTSLAACGRDFDLLENGKPYNFCSFLAKATASLRVYLDAHAAAHAEVDPPAIIACFPGDDHRSAFCSKARWFASQLHLAPGPSGKLTWSGDTPSIDLSNDAIKKTYCPGAASADACAKGFADLSAAEQAARVFAQTEGATDNVTADPVLCRGAGSRDACRDSFLAASEADEIERIATQIRHGDDGFGGFLSAVCQDGAFAAKLTQSVSGACLPQGGGFAVDCDDLSCGGYFVCDYTGAVGVCTDAKSGAFLGRLSGELNRLRPRFGVNGAFSLDQHDGDHYTDGDRTCTYQIDFLLAGTATAADEMDVNTQSYYGNSCDLSPDPAPPLDHFHFTRHH